MDLATIIGFFGGLGLTMVVMIVSGSLAMYWDFLSIMIVVGGALAATVMRSPMKDVVGSLKASTKAIFNTTDDPEELINMTLEIANTARKDSILALEKLTIENDFLAMAVRYMVDGYDQAVINNILDLEIRCLKQRHKTGRAFFESMGEMCPAFGMIGTVIGLIVIMANLTDPSKIGPGLAVALITTLYGSLVANLVFVPIAAKLKTRSQEEVKNMLIVREAVNGILEGHNPRTIQQHLVSYLDGKPAEAA